MAHRAEVIAVTKNVGIPPDLSNIVADYAKLSDYDRLSQMLRFNDIAKVIIAKSYPCNIAGPQYLLIRDTCDGLEITSSVTGDDRDLWDYECFVDAMNQRSITLEIGDELDSWGLARDVLDRLEEKLIDHWESL